MHKPKILFTTPIIEYPPKGGPELRIANSIKALSAISEIFIYSRASYDRLGDSNAIQHFKQLSQKFYFAKSVLSRPRGNNFSLLKKTLRRIRKRLFIFWDIIDILKITQQNNINIIWLGYGNISYYLLFLLKIFSSGKLVIDTDSVWSRFLLRGVGYQPSLGKKIKRWLKGNIKRIEEYLGVQCADITTAVSEYDYQYYRSLTKNKNKIQVFSNVIDLESYKQRPFNETIKRPAIYLAGSFGPNSPMEIGACWTIKKILPLVWREIPQLHFYLVGRGATEKLYKLRNDNITITGEVPTVLPYLCNVDIAIVPLHFESGTRFKILEAAACGIPIISTTLGAEGLEVTHLQDIIIADTPEEFAQSIITLLKNTHLYETISKNAYKNIIKNYTIQKASRQARNILKILTE